MGTVHWRKTDARYKKGFPMTVAVPTITDVVFDFCGVLLDWRTRACLEGRFDDATVFGPKSAVTNRRAAVVGCSVAVNYTIVG